MIVITTHDAAEADYDELEARMHADGTCISTCGRCADARWSDLRAAVDSLRTDLSPVSPS